MVGLAIQSSFFLIVMIFKKENRGGNVLKRTIGILV